MDFLKLLPLLFRLIELAPKIRDGLRGGGSIVDLLRTLGPDILKFIQSIGEQLFPNIPPEGQVEVGALKTFDQVKVRWLQESLNKLGIAVPPLGVDGDYGQKTKDAVAKFQKAHGLLDDGWMGQITEAAIATELAKTPVTPAEPVAPLTS
jgi:hypothetical protein